MRKEAQADIIIDEQELQKWLYTSEPVEPTINQLERLPEPVLLDTISILKNPFLKYYRQNINVVSANLALTKSRALPDFSIGFSKLDIGNSTKYFGYNVGVNIPLWYQPYRARNEAAQIAVKIAEADYANIIDTTKAAYKQQLQQYQKWNEQISYY